MLASVVQGRLEIPTLVRNLRNNNCAMHTARCCVMQYYAVLCRIMQYYEVLCSIMQYYEVLCNIMHPSF